MTSSLAQSNLRRNYHSMKLARFPKIYTHISCAYINHTFPCNRKPNYLTEILDRVVWILVWVWYLWKDGVRELGWRLWREVVGRRGGERGCNATWWSPSRLGWTKRKRGGILSTFNVKPSNSIGQAFQYQIKFLAFHSTLATVPWNAVLFSSLKTQCKYFDIGSPFKASAVDCIVSYSKFEQSIRIVLLFQIYKANKMETYMSVGCGTLSPISTIRKNNTKMKKTTTKKKWERNERLWDYGWNNSQARLTTT